MIFHQQVLAELIINDIPKKYPSLKLSVGIGGAELDFEKDFVRELLIKINSDEITKQFSKKGDDNWSLFNLVETIPIFHYHRDFDEIVKYFSDK